MTEDDRDTLHARNFHDHIDAIERRLAAAWQALLGIHSPSAHIRGDCWCQR